MREAILALMERAMAGAEELPAKSRADLYAAAAELLGCAPSDFMLRDAANAADKAAQSLREAETLQLTFASLLRTP